MATIEHFTNLNEFKKITSATRATVITAFFGNNVEHIKAVAEAYKFAKNSPGTIELTGMPVYEPEKLGLPSDANQLLFNDGDVVGRFSGARVIVGEPNCDLNYFLPIIREAVYGIRFKKMYASEAIVGLDKDFMVKAHLLIPKDFENTLYSWLLNFQYVNEEYAKIYEASKAIPEGDIYVFSDPDWSHPDFPYGLAFFDPHSNIAVLLGLRYFGEHKKGTLTLAWACATRHGYAACHGGMKRYDVAKGKSYQVAVFGLSGSGKSTITHAKHDNKYNTTVLHDDAFILNDKDKFSIALEPAYFDKTQDYPMGSPDNKYILTQQNNGVLITKDKKIYALGEDIRNGNGRAIKSKLWAPNRVDRIDEGINGIFWLMKDDTIPPVLKISGAALGSTMGATLATKRTSAEKLAPGVDPNALVIEPYANPFRVYQLGIDYEKFKNLIASGIECYILNTGSFLGKKVQPHHTLGIIETIVEGKAKFEKWENFSDISIMPVEGFEASFSNKDYKAEFIKRMQDRVVFIKAMESAKGGLDKLPKDALEALEKVIKEVL